MTLIQTAAQVANLTYPCYLIVYGHERTFRTKFRGEHGGVFWSGFVPDLAALEAEVEACLKRYDGSLTEMMIKAIVPRPIPERDETVWQSPEEFSGLEEKTLV